MHVTQVHDKAKRIVLTCSRRTIKFLEGTIFSILEGIRTNNYGLQLYYREGSASARTCSGSHFSQPISLHMSNMQCLHAVLIRYRLLQKHCGDGIELKYRLQFVAKRLRGETTLNCYSPVIHSFNTIHSATNYSTWETLFPRPDSRMRMRGHSYK